MIDVEFELVLLDREFLGEWKYDRSHYSTRGISSKRYIGRKIQGMFGRYLFSGLDKIRLSKDKILWKAFLIYFHKVPWYCFAFF